MFYVYVLKSAKDGRLYKGYCGNVEQRLRDHNGGKVFSTKGFRPWKLVFMEAFDTEQQALDREKYLKSGTGRAFLKSLGI